MKPVRRQVVGAAVVAAAIWTLPPPPPAWAVSCGDTGATVTVVLYNPTGSTISSGITLSGSSLSGQETCTTGEDFYHQDTSISVGAYSEESFTFSDLNSGMWVHSISVSNGSNVYQQHQKGVMLKAAPDPNDPTVPNDPDKPFSEVRWSYFPNSIEVKTADDAESGACDSEKCTFRQALTSVNSLSTSASNPALIFFTESPGDMDKTDDLEISKDWVTVDGTNSLGNPWKVGDTFGPQSPFPITIDLKDKTKIVISGSDVTLKGLEIKNSGSTSPQNVLIKSTNYYTTILSTRIDGGAGALASCGGSCNDGIDTNRLVELGEWDNLIANVEARNAHGFAFHSSKEPEVVDSWIHHNFRGGFQTNSAFVSRSLIESNGYNEEHDLIRNDSNGIGGGFLDLAALVTNANVIRNNGGSGIGDVRATGTAVSLNHDYLCGNRIDGASIQLFNQASNPFATGMTAAYNDWYGIRVNGNSGGEASFDDDNAFTANDLPGLRNASNGEISATNNQWRDIGGACSTWDDISGDDVDCSSPQDYLNTSIVLDPNEVVPVFPSNVIRTGQAVRVQGKGFNAIDGNQLAANYAGDEQEPPACTLGADPDPESGCCHRLNESNPCSGDPPTAIADKGNCVAIRDRSGGWKVGAVKGVAPTTLTFALGSNVSCIGEHDELLRVSKRDGMGDPIHAELDFCTNRYPRPW